MKSCLIVDDSKVVRMVARKILEGLSFDIDEAEDGQKALEACQRHMPDAVLLDLNHPLAGETLHFHVKVTAIRQATDDDLQILTIHKAKGLEFGTVIVPGLDKGPGRSDMPLFLWKETVDGLLLAPIKESGTDDDRAYRYLRNLEVAAEDTEAARLLYVAATRAENRLHLLACTRCDDHGDLKPPAPRALLMRAWPVAEEHYARMVPEQLAMDFMHAPRQPFTSLSRLDLDLARILPPPPVRWSAPPQGKEEAQIEFSWAGETARHVGVQPGDA